MVEYCATKVIRCGDGGLQVINYFRHRSSFVIVCEKYCSHQRSLARCTVDLDICSSNDKILYDIHISHSSGPVESRMAPVVNRSVYLKTIRRGWRNTVPTLFSAGRC